jgi:hypothetical protein
MNKEISIGIFGDSFACRAWGNSSGKSWPEILKEKHGYHNVINHAEAGSSLFFSYNNYLKSYKHNNFDKIVFVITSPGRLSLPNHVQINDQWSSRHVVPVSLQADFEGLDFLINKTHDEQEKSLFMNHKRALHAAEEYFTYIYDDVQDVHNNMGLVNNLMTMRPDGLFIPTVRNDSAEEFGLSDPAIDHNKFPSVLTDICKQEITVTGNDYFTVASSGRDSRHCHMSEENNEIFADKIAHYLETGEFALSVDDFIYNKNLDVTTVFPRMQQ